MLAHDGNNSTNIRDFGVILLKRYSKMGGNSDKKKKIRVSHIFKRNPYMKFQNISIHGFAMHMKATNGQKLQRAITPTKFH